MLVRVKYTGDGTEGNKYRVPLPTYTEKLTLLDQGVAYVFIPEEDHPDLLSHPSAKVEATTIGSVLIGLDADGHDEWHKHLDQRYQEHKGKFRPEVA